MPERRGAKPKARTFTIEQLRHARASVATAAKQEGGCIVVDKEGHRIFSVWIPRGPLGTGD